jgi:hypothetical protein
MLKLRSKVAHNQPQTFFSQARPGCPNQPRIDFLYYKNVPRLICLLICASMLKRRFLRERGMAVNPKMDYRFFFFCNFQKDSVMASLGLKEMEKFDWKGRKKEGKGKGKNRKKTPVVPIGIRTHDLWVISQKRFPTQHVPHESPILGQLIDLISPTKINLFKTRFKSYDPWDMANSLLCFFNKKIED